MASAAGTDGFEAWRPPVDPPIRLVGRHFDVNGAPAVVLPAILGHWDAARVAAWESTPTEGGVRLLGPSVSLAVQDLYRLRVSFMPESVREISVNLITQSEKTVEFQRENRRLQVPVPPLAATTSLDEPVVVEVELDKIIGGFWDEFVTEDTLERVELVLSGEAPKPSDLREVTIESVHARFSDRAAGHQLLEVDSIRRPGFFVHAGVGVRTKVSVPEMGAELRWHGGAAAEGATGVVRLLGPDGRLVRELHRSQGETSWRQRGVDLAAWAGQDILLELAIEGSGVGFFADPRLVPSADLDGVARSATPDVIVYLIDTLRADFLGTWHRGGNRTPVRSLMGRSFSPNLDRLAEEGLVFGRAYSTSAWTKPAIPSLMTGIWPTTHEVTFGPHRPVLPASVPLIQQRFTDAGWRTGGFVASPHGSTTSKLERGYSASHLPRYWHGAVAEMAHPPASAIHETLLDWIAEEPEQPFFAYVQTLEVHEFQREYFADRVPESVPPAARDAFAYAIALEEADAEFGRLRAQLERLERRRPLLIVLLSDHGEAFGDHGHRGHGFSLFSSQTHIPLIFWSDGELPSGTVLDPVSLVDVAPTILDWVGLDPLPEAQGRSLAGYASGRAPQGYDFIPISLISFVWAPDAPQQFAIVDRNDLGKVHRVRGESDWQYDLHRDPCEIRGAQANDSADLARLEDWLRGQERDAQAFRARHGKLESVTLSAEDLLRLEALGYIE